MGVSGAGPACLAMDWCWQNPRPTGDVLYSVWAANEHSAWAVGQSGTLLRWDGRSWISQRSGTDVGLYSIWGADEDHVWAVGLGGTILRWNGKVWSPQKSGTTSFLFGVFGTAANNVWAVGSGGAILHQAP